MSKGCVSGREGDGHKYKGYSCSLVDPLQTLQCVSVLYSFGCFKLYFFYGKGC